MSAVEIACWDLIGRSLDTPIHVLLGGAVRERIPVYANGWYPAERTPDAYAQRAAATVARGHRALKFDPFGDALGHAGDGRPADRHRVVAAVREAVGAEVRLMIEAHDRFDVRTARSIARWLEPYDITWLEAPVFSEDIGALRPRDRWVACPDRRRRAADAAVPVRRSRPPGPRGHLAARDARRRRRVGDAPRSPRWPRPTGPSIAPHNARGPIATAVNVELAAWLPGLLMLETFVDDAVPLAREIAPLLPEVVDGFVRPTSRPGIGIDIDESAARAHPFDRNGVLRLFEPGWESRRGVRPSTAAED